jgi:antitoxin HicB
MGWHFEYPASIKQDEAGFFLVTFSDFPEAATDARGPGAALVEAADCIEEAIAGRIKRGEEIPAPSPTEPGMVTVALPALWAMKAALYRAARESWLSPARLAAKLGTNEKEMRILFDPGQPCSAAALEAALHSLGKRVGL